MEKDNVKATYSKLEGETLRVQQDYRFLIKCAFLCFSFLPPPTLQLYGFFSPNPPVWLWEGGRGVWSWKDLSSTC